MLKTSGYRTQISGKWHFGGDYPLQKPDTWTPGDEKHPTPLQPKAKRELEWVPQVSLEDGLKTTVDWFKQQGE